MKCTVSQENYLKAIYLLQIQKESVRAVDVSNYMALSKPSVSNALKKLRTEPEVSDARYSPTDGTDMHRLGGRCVKTPLF